MKFGNGLLRVDSGEDLEYFVSQYERTPEQFAADYELTDETILTPDNIAHIAYIDSDGSIAQLFSLQEGDSMIVSREERLSGYGITNSQHMAFFTLVREGKMVAMFAADSGPYDCDDDSFEYKDVTRDEVLNTIGEWLKSAAGQETFPVTADNTLLFEQL